MWSSFSVTKCLESRLSMEACSLSKKIYFGHDFILSHVLGAMTAFWHTHIWVPSLALELQALWFIHRFVAWTHPEGLVCQRLATDAGPAWKMRRTKATQSLDPRVFQSYNSNPTTMWKPFWRVQGRIELTEQSLWKPSDLNLNWQQTWQEWK